MPCPSAPRPPLLRAAACTILLGCPELPTEAYEALLLAEHEGSVALTTFAASSETGCTALSFDRAGVKTGMGLSEVTITDYRTVGHTRGAEASAWPGTTPGVDTVVTKRISGGCEGTTEWTAPRLSPAANGLWDTTGRLLTLGDCYSSACGRDEPSSCSGTYAVEISPRTRDCSDYDPVRIDLSYAYPNRDIVAPEAECQAGSGRFQLVPTMSGDADRDGLYHVTLRPFMVSGTGVLTNDASLTGVASVAGTPHTPRVMKAGAPYRFDATDHLLTPGAVSVAVGQGFAPDQLGGNPAFVVEELDPADLPALQVDLAWSCGRTGGMRVTRARGYQLSLATLGCGIPQKLTFRPIYGDGPRRMEWEPYGTPGVVRVVHTQTTPEGEAFVFERGPLTLRAVLLAAGPEQAILRVDEVRLLDHPVCTPGTYVVERE